MLRKKSIDKYGQVFNLLPGTLIDTAKNNVVTNNGATVTADHNGRAGRAWAFNGSSNLTIPQNAVFQGTTQTIQIAAKSNLQSGELLNFVYKATPTISGIQISYVTGGIEVSIASNQGFYTWGVGDGLSLTYNDWNYISVAVENFGTSVRLYIAVNGVAKLLRDYSNTNYMSASSQNIVIGSSFNGSIDYIDFRTKYLVIDHIKKLYNHWRSH